MYKGTILYNDKSINKHWTKFPKITTGGAMTKLTFACSYSIFLCLFWELLADLVWVSVWGTAQCGMSGSELNVFVSGISAGKSPSLLIALPEDPDKANCCDWTGCQGQECLDMCVWEREHVSSINRWGC